MWYYNYSYVKAVTNVYPNIGLDSSRFSTPPSTSRPSPSPFSLNISIKENIGTSLTIARSFSICTLRPKTLIH